MRGSQKILNGLDGAPAGNRESVEPVARAAVHHRALRVRVESNCQRVVAGPLGELD
jgi:hypothetical protein